MVHGSVLHQVVGPVDQVGPRVAHVPFRLQQTEDEAATLVQGTVVDRVHQIGQVLLIVVLQVCVAGSKRQDVFVSGLGGKVEQQHKINTGEWVTMLIHT